MPKGNESNQNHPNCAACFCSTPGPPQEAPSTKHSPHDVSQTVERFPAQVHPDGDVNEFHAYPEDLSIDCAIEPDSQWSLRNDKVQVSRPPWSLGRRAKYFSFMAFLLTTILYGALSFHEVNTTGNIYLLISIRTLVDCRIPIDTAKD